MKQLIWLAFFMYILSAQAQIEFRAFEEVLTYADHHSLTIQGAELGEQIARSGKKEANAFMLPSVSASAGYNDNITLQPTLVPATLFNPTAEAGTFEELTFGRKYLYSAGIQAQWDILHFQRMFAAQTAEMQVKASQINTEQNRFNVYNQLASTYYSILLTQESIRVYAENTKTAASILALAEEKFQRGVLSESELNGARIKHIQGQRNLHQAEYNLEEFYLQLQTQLNTELEVKVVDTPESFVLDQSLLQQAHPEVLRQASEVATYEALLKQQKAALLPSISLYYQYNYSWATDDFLNFSAANGLPQQIFGVQVSIPIFTGLATHERINQSAWEVRLQQLQLDNLKLAKQKEDEMLALDLDRTSTQLVENKQIWFLQQQNDAHAENQYQAGLLSLGQRLDQYDDLLVAQDYYLQSLAAYTLAQYKLYVRQLDFQSPAFHTKHENQ